MISVRDVQSMFATGGVIAFVVALSITVKTNNQAVFAATVSDPAQESVSANFSLERNVDNIVSATQATTEESVPAVNTNAPTEPATVIVPGVLGERDNAADVIQDEPVQEEPVNETQDTEPIIETPIEEEPIAEDPVPIKPVDEEVPTVEDPVDDTPADDTTTDDTPTTST